MTLPLTPHMLAGAYEFLRTTPPYRAWKLPHADTVAFTVNRHKGHIGDSRGSPLELYVSTVICGTTATLMWVTGHEMIHLHQYLAKKETPGTVHNADFRRKAERACAYHGWDSRLFI